ncbi:glycosyltransferase family 4 protein [candidate division TA06 bacterium]|nr:glycosyltransferase family 4 protein [candidate division TA06 bacterium]
MKIAVWHNLPSGGGKRALYNHICGLIERGHDIEVWQPSCADRSFLDLSAKVKVTITDCKYYDKQAVSKYDKLKRLIGHRLNIINLKNNAIKSASQLCNTEYDLLFANTCQFMASPFIGRYSNLPSVLYLQEPKRSIFEANNNNPLALPNVPKGLSQIPSFIEDMGVHEFYKLKAREEITNARAFKKLLVNSYFSRESVLRAYGINSEVCYLGVDTNLFKTDNLTHKDNYIIMVGSITKNKNIDFIVNAMGHIAEPRPLLVIVSNFINNEYQNMIIRLAEDRCVPIKILSNVTDLQLVELYSNAKMLTYAPRLEPFGYAPLEANACSLPVVAVKEGGVRETITNGINGLLVDAEPESMADAINDLLCNSRKAIELGENGRRIVAEKWSLDNANDRLEAKLINAIK